MRLPSKPPLSPKHREERLKLAASGLQALALALFGAVLIAPAFNAQLAAPVWVKLALSAIASVAEGFGEQHDALGIRDLGRLPLRIERLSKVGRHVLGRVFLLERFAECRGAQSTQRRRVLHSGGPNSDGHEYQHRSAVTAERA